MLFIALCKDKLKLFRLKLNNFLANGVERILGKNFFFFYCHSSNLKSKNGFLTLESKFGGFLTKLTQVTAS